MLFSYAYAFIAGFILLLEHWIIGSGILVGTVGSHKSVSLLYSLP